MFEDRPFLFETMDQKRDIAILSRALSERLISFDQYSQILRKLNAHPRSGINSQLLENLGLSQDQVSSLVSGTADQHVAVTQDAGPARAAPLDSHKIDTLSLMPDAVPALANPSGPASAPTEAPEDECPANDQVVGDQVASDQAASDQAADDRVMLDTKLLLEVKREIARGGLGRVSLAHDPQLGRDVAVKEMLPRRTQSAERVERFLLEAQVTGQLEHPGIVPIYALGINAENRPFYTMKLISGRTLAELIYQYHGLDKNDPRRTAQLYDLLRSLVDVCNAIAFAHNRGILHRDIKPSNIMSGDFGETLVVDWGLAKIFRGDANARLRSDVALGVNESTLDWTDAIRKSGPTRRSVTVEGSVVGTIPYMSPEQARGAVETLDERADIFALGATFYEILVGRPPYHGERDELLEKARLGQFPSPRSVHASVPPALEAICLKALAAEVGDRYESAQQLGEEIARWQSGEPVEAYPEPWWDRAGRWMRKHRTFCISTAAAAMVLLLSIGVWEVSERRRIDGLTTDTRTLLLDGQVLFNKDQLGAASEKFDQAKGRASTDPALGPLATEIDWWIDQTQRRVAAIEAKKNAREQLVHFRALYDDARFFGTLLTGYEIEENIQQAKQQATAALALFGVSADSDTPPAVDAALYSSDEIADVARSCRDLRMVLADAEAQPLPHDTEESSRAAARRALVQLDRIGTNQRQLKAYHLRRAVYLRQAGDATAAAIEMQRAEDTRATGADDYYLIGDLHYRQEDYPRAIRYFEQTLRRSPDHFWAQYFLGVCQLRLKRWPEAVVSLTASASRRADFIYIYLLRGIVHSEMGDIEAAEEDFGRAAGLDAEEYGLYINRGLARLRHRRIPEAIGDLEVAARLKPREPHAFINLAEAHRILKQYDKALGHIARAIDVDPGSARAYRLRAQIRLEQKDEPAAEKDLLAAIDRAAPGSYLLASLYAEYGRMLHQRNNLPRALATYQQALDERSDYFAALVLKALALIGLNRDEEAIRAFDRFLAEGPILAEVYRPGQMLPSRLNAGGGVGLFDSEADTLRIDADPRRTLAIVYRERGLARMRVGDEAGAMHDFARATELVPRAEIFPLAHDRLRYGAMHMRRAWAYLLKGKDLALEEFNLGIKIDPQNPEPYTGRGYVHVLKGDYQQGVADADKAIRLGPENPGVYFNAAGIYSRAYKLVQADSDQADRQSLAQTYRAAAIESLRQCFERSSDPKKFYLPSVKNDHSLDPIRSLEEFKKLLKEFSS